MSSEQSLVPPRADAVLSADPSPVERFIADRVEPLRGELNEWTQLVDREELMRRAAARAKLRPEKAGTDSSGAEYKALVHPDGVAGGLGPQVTTLISDQALRVLGSRTLTRSYLAASGVPLPEGRSFGAENWVQAGEYIRELGSAVVLRADHTGREGATTIAPEAGDLDDAWALATADGGDVLVEERHPGVVVRLGVIGETVGAAAVHLPPYVIGDGRSRILDLLTAEREYRAPNEYLAGELAADPATLSRQGLDEESVLETGAVRVVAARTSRAAGGLTVDVTGQVAEALKEIAIEAVWAVPGLDSAAVDIVTPGLGDPDAERAAVIGLDPTCSVEDFRYPAYGRMRMVHDALLRRVLDLFTGS